MMHFSNGIKMCLFLSDQTPSSHITSFSRAKSSTTAIMRFFSTTLTYVLLTFGFFLTATAESSSAIRTVFVHLFEWKWTDVARECEEFLGPKGYAAVQVSPPQEHVKGSQWWTRYQPVSYMINSRGGTRKEFEDMVDRCRKNGVDIYVDAVINHMTGVGSGIGWAGSSYGRYSYPAVPFGRNDFHFCGRPDNDIRNYRDAYEVRNCELLNLADLATEKDYVREKLADYLNDLQGMGVSGFRIDAAKHMEPRDLQAILQRVHGSPYVFQEVIAQDPSEPIRAQDYFGTGDVTEFNYGIKIFEHFKQRNKIKYLKTFGEAWGLLRSDKAIVFTDNHDNQRSHGGGGDVLTFRNGKLYDLANVFVLAWPYGYPKVMSSFEFSDTDKGPPSSSPYSNSGISCGFHKPWKCEHRWRPIANMVAFRNVAADTFKVTNWWSNGENAIAFGRGNRGFVVINREHHEMNESFQTDMSPGMYCNVIAHEAQDGKCTGTPVTVGEDGRVRVRIGPMTALAIHAGARVRRSTARATPKPCVCTGTHIAARS